METVLDVHSRLQGDVVTDGDLRVEGIVEGSLKAGGKIVVAAGARVLGPITAAGVEVAGTVEGDISTTGHLLLAHGGKITGDVKAHYMRVEEGGVIQGKVLTKVSAPPEPPQRSG